MVCKVCGIDKPLDEYYVDKRGYHKKTCKSCVIKNEAERRKQNPEKFKAYGRTYHEKHKEERNKQDAEYRKRVQGLKTPCVKCGDTRLYVIDFHHIDPSEKSFNINRKSSKKDFSVIEEEVKKCVCLCRNCHMEFHYFYGMNPKKPKESLNEYLGG